MTEIAEFKRGAGGRPTRAEAQRRLGNMLETAMRLFAERGYEALRSPQAAALGLGALGDQAAQASVTEPGRVRAGW